MLRYAITDSGLFGNDLDAMLERLLQVAAHVDYLQIREPNLSARALENFSRRVMRALSHLAARPKVLINHRADIAMACKADGVHLRSSPGELAPGQVREMYRLANMPSPVVSVSCHSLEEVNAAREADLILFAPVFEKLLPGADRPHAGSGLALLADACRAAAPVPVLALGGVTPARQQECVRAGAAGVAGIRLFLQTTP